MEIETWREPFTDNVLVRVTTDAGDKHTRELSWLKEADCQDLKIAAMYWRHADRAFALGHPKAALTEQCLAVERLFPHLREELPA